MQRSGRCSLRRGQTAWRVRCAFSAAGQLHGIAPHTFWHSPAISLLPLQGRVRVKLLSAANSRPDSVNSFFSNDGNHDERRKRAEGLPSGQQRSPTIHQIRNLRRATDATRFQWRRCRLLNGPQHPGYARRSVSSARRSALPPRDMRRCSSETAKSAASSPVRWRYRRPSQSCSSMPIRCPLHLLKSAGCRRARNMATRFVSGLLLNFL